jgi:hypothetical protein
MGTWSPSCDTDPSCAPRGGSVRLSDTQGLCRPHPPQRLSLEGSDGRDGTTRARRDGLIGRPPVAGNCVNHTLRPGPRQSKARSRLSAHRFPRNWPESSEPPVDAFSRTRGPMDGPRDGPPLWSVSETPSACGEGQPADPVGLRFQRTTDCRPAPLRSLEAAEPGGKANSKSCHPSMCPMRSCGSLHRGFVGPGGMNAAPQSAEEAHGSAL